MASLAEALTAAFDLYAAGRCAEAAELCRRILAVAPDQAGAAQIAGAAAAALGRLRDSDAAFRRLLILRPADAGGWSNLGNLRATADDDKTAALVAYDRAQICDPLLADVRANRAALLSQAGRKSAAAAAARGALIRDPGHAGATVNLADGLSGDVDRQVGLRWGRRAARLAPGSAQARRTLAAAAARAGRMDTATAAARTALALAPAAAAAWENLTLIAAKSDDPAGCDRALARAQITGASPSLARTAAAACLATARPAAALAWLDVALRDAPDDVGLHWNRATALLQAGRWAEGWRAFERRRGDDRAEPPWRDLGVPTWTGAPFPGGRLLLYAEQGLGDALQMLRFVPLVAALGATKGGGEVILEVQPPLVGLARRVTGAATVIARGDALPAFDLECPLMSLPGVFGATPDHIPGAVPFLAADPARVAAWRARLAAATGHAGPRRPRIGVVWAGNPRFADDRRRSPGLSALEPLLRAVPEADFFALQMGEGRRDPAAVGPPGNLCDLGLHDLGADIADLDDTAAIMAQLDLVISSCTLPAHLAIALDRPLWLLLSYAPDWRWLLDRDDTPWHPRARLFRQTVPGDWAGAVGRMTAALKGGALKGGALKSGAY